jgi:hypothetical protein
MGRRGSIHGVEGGGSLFCPLSAEPVVESRLEVRRS